MKKTPTPHTIRLLAVATTLAFVAVGCGGSDSSGAGDTAPQTTTQGSTAGSTETTTAGATSLKGICPDTIALQTDWMPEAEHGFLYNLIGPGKAVDTRRFFVICANVPGGCSG